MLNLELETLLKIGSIISGSGVVGFAMGFFTRILTDRFRLKTIARADIKTLINHEIFVLRSGRRDKGVSNISAISDMTRTADRYRELITTRRSRHAFDRQYSRYKDQIDKKNLHEECDPNFITFGYHNMYEANQRLHDLRGVI